jgi:hypothetical protein
MNSWITFAKTVSYLVEVMFRAMKMCAFVGYYEYFGDVRGRMYRRGGKVLWLLKLFGLSYS